MNTFALIKPLDDVWLGVRNDLKLELLHHGLGSHVSTTPTINNERTNLPSNGAPRVKDGLPLIRVFLIGKAT